VNYDGTRELVTRLLAQPRFSKLVFWGDGGVYSPGAPLPLSEVSPLGPANDYLRSKSMAEQLVLDYGADEGLRHSILRPVSAYGPRGVHGVGRLLRVVARGPVALCPSGWDFRIPLVHVRDVCGAALLVAERSETDGEVYNVADAAALPGVELVRFVAEVLGKPFVALPSVSPVALRAVLHPLAQGLRWLSDNVTHRPPLLEAAMVDALGVDRVFANGKLLAAGYELTYPDARHGLTDAILWYQRAGWL
jgi:nucleoside-diphosphate-sugar epimerase